MDFVGEGEGGKIWENGIETCKISCMKRVASPGSMHDTGCLGTSVCINVSYMLFNQNISSWQWTLEKLTRRGKSQMKL